MKKIMTKEFKKPATTIKEQIDLLVSRGMGIPDPEEAARFLSHVNYYRLRGYWLHDEQEGSSAEHGFRPNIIFSEIRRVYDFDKELRLLFFDIIESFEVSLKSQWSYVLSHKYGPHAYLNTDIHVEKKLQENLERLNKEIERSDEIFIRHYKEKYQGEGPPIWMVSEIIPIGLLARFYNCISDTSIKREIAEVYGLNQHVFKSWIYHLSVIRNICAHHNRLYDRDFSRISPNRKIFSLKSYFINNNKVYNTIIFMLYLLPKISSPFQERDWKDKLSRLICCADDAVLLRMGFPENWEISELWR